MAGIRTERSGGGDPNTDAKHAQPGDGCTGATDTGFEISAAANLPPEKLAPAQELRRKAQFYLDFVEAENSYGFHAPEEALRILGESINFAREGQLALRPPATSSSSNAQ